DGGAKQQAATDHGGLRKLEQGVENGSGKGDVIAAPQRVVAAAVDELNELAQFLDRGLPRSCRWLAAAMDGHDADLQAAFEHQSYCASPRVCNSASRLGRPRGR